MSFFSRLPLRPGRLFRNTALLGTGMGLRTLSQALVFLLVARLLGSKGYGAFSATLALASVWSNFSGFGGQIILLRDTSRDPDRFSNSLGLTLATVGISILPTLSIYFFTAWWFLDRVSWSLIVPLGLGELVLWPFANVTVYAYQGFERMGRSARMTLTPAFSRLVMGLVFAVLILLQPNINRLILWGWLYALAALSAACYTSYKVLHDLGRPAWPGWKGLISHLRAGLPFSFLGSAQKLYLDADKFLLAKMTSLTVVGVYSAGYRFVDLTLIPINSLIAAAVPRLFRAGVEGTNQTLRAVLHLLKPAIAYAIIIGIGLNVAAPLILYLLGESYETAISVVRWLAWLPLLTAPRLLLQSAFATGDKQKTAMFVVLLGALINIVLNLWWIALWSWKGAVTATYVAEISMIVIYLMLKTRTS